ncbi:MAG: hypothetical protein HZA02_11080, partial [Nitrospinae bacterium]|nr:hypothetical protein [Nitrospinota bacterium]
MKLMTWLCQTADREVRAVLGRVARMQVKIALWSLSLMAVVLGVGLASAESKGQPSKLEPFHVARTSAEKALDDLFRRADQDG